MKNPPNRYAVAVVGGSVTYPVARSSSKSGARAAQRRFVADWREGRVIAIGSGERRRPIHPRSYYTAPKMNGDIWDLKSDYSRRFHGTVVIIDTLAAAEHYDGVFREAAPGQMPNLRLLVEALRRGRATP